METINDRMEIIVNQMFDGNKAAFAKTIGLQPTGLSNYLGTKRRSKPSVDMVAKIITKLNVDARWLITGEKAEDPPRSVENSVETKGDFSPASLHGDVSVGATDAVLVEKVKSLEALLAEKERLIRLYEKMTGK